MSYYNRTFEDQRKASMTPDKILEIAGRTGFFTVSLRWRDSWRDSWLRKRCATLRKQGHLIGGRRIERGQLVYRLRNKETTMADTPNTPAPRTENKFKVVDLKPELNAAVIELSDDRMMTIPIKDGVEVKKGAHVALDKAALDDNGVPHEASEIVRVHA